MAISAGETDNSTGPNKS